MRDFLNSILQVWPGKSLIILICFLLPELLTPDTCKCTSSQLQRICFLRNTLIGSLFISTPAWTCVGCYWNISYWMLLSIVSFYIKQNTLNENVCTLKYIAFVFLLVLLYLNISIPHVQRERERERKQKNHGNNASRNEYMHSTLATVSVPALENQMFLVCLLVAWI